MSQIGETFFTAVGCMDGRVQDAIAKYGQEKFGVLYPDTITEAGLVGLLAKDTIDAELVKAIAFKLSVSLEKHHSKGIIVHGHQECAGNPVSDEQHISDIKKTVARIAHVIENKIPVIGVFVKRNGDNWVVEEVTPSPASEFVYA